jgi:hypothetical protein
MRWRRPTNSLASPISSVPVKKARKICFRIALIMNWLWTNQRSWEEVLLRRTLGMFVPSVSHHLVSQNIRNKLCNFYPYTKPDILSKFPGYFYLSRRKLPRQQYVREIQYMSFSHSWLENYQMQSSTGCRYTAIHTYYCDNIHARVSRVPVVPLSFASDLDAGSALLEQRYRDQYWISMSEILILLFVRHSTKWTDYVLEFSSCNFASSFNSKV